MSPYLPFLNITFELSECERAFKSIPIEKVVQNGWHGRENYASDYASTTECPAQVATSSDGPGVSIAMAHSVTDAAALPAKIRKIVAERYDSRNPLLLLKRQFFHSHRVQPMEMDQVMSDRDSEDEVYDDIADLEDRRMLDDFVDVSKDEKQLMHLWNSFVRKQRVLADGHVSWACEAFSKHHGPDLVQSPALFWCWKLFMIKLWNHGLLDACVMNCNLILQTCQNERSDATKS
ncbi:polycomb group protein VERNALIZATION 2-like [Hibiscus syriacus]|uniref:polycomb group protein VERNALIZATION 2-like n=1 Tax=Hibiscus syriacus TaxID=106335 RepID=UPI001925006A|nr:polycomb group protein VERNALIZATION 2-like [Hibiscus syriacus]